MLRTYNAVLTGNHLELTEDTREESDRPREVYVTFCFDLTLVESLLLSIPLLS